MSIQIQSQVLSQPQLDSILDTITNYCGNVIDHKNSVVEYCKSGPNTLLSNRPNAAGAPREYNPKNLKRKNRIRFVKKLNEHFAYSIDKILVIVETFKPCIPNSPAKAAILNEITRWELLLVNSKTQLSQIDAQTLNDNSVNFGFNLAPLNNKHWMAYGNATTSSAHLNMLKRTTSYPDLLNIIPHGAPFYQI